MKINQNSTIRSPAFEVTPGRELHDQAPRRPASRIDNTATLKQANARNLEQEKMATEAKAFSNLTAGLLQKSLANALPNRSELLNNTAKELLPKLPEILVRSGTDPERFISSIQEQVASSNFAHLGSMNNEDIYDLLLILMMLNAKDAREDLKEIMGSIKSINSSKKDWRALIDQSQWKTATSSKNDNDD